MPDKEFWIARWEKNEIGFHQAGINPFLSAYGPRFLKPEDRVLVPLCGKSLDLLHLSRNVRAVIGVELSRLAVDAFFGENHLPVQEDGPGYFKSGNIQLICADYFEVSEKTIGLVDAVYDRAALVALDASTRLRYARHTAGLVRTGGRILLLTFEFDETNRTGPPFHVSPAEVTDLYASDFRVELLQTESRSDARFGGIREHCFLLTRRGPTESM